MSPLSTITNPEKTSQFKLVKDSNSNRVSDLLKHNTIPLTLQTNLSTIRDTGKEFELKVNLSKTITNKNFNVDIASLSDTELMYDFAKELNFDVKAQSIKSLRDRTLIKLLESPSFMIFASGVSNTTFMPSDPNELCNRL